jgi:hypothetical protein
MFSGARAIGQGILAVESGYQQAGLAKGVCSCHFTPQLSPVLILAVMDGACKRAHAQPNIMYLTALPICIIVRYKP